MMNGGRGQRMARMLQMQGQSQQVSNNAGAQTDMQYNPPQNAQMGLYGSLAGMAGSALGGQFGGALGKKIFGR